MWECREGGGDGEYGHGGGGGVGAVTGVGREGGCPGSNFSGGRGFGLETSIVAVKGDESGGFLDGWVCVRGFLVERCCWMDVVRSSAHPLLRATCGQTVSCGAMNVYSEEEMLSFRGCNYPEI